MEEMFKDNQNLLNVDLSNLKSAQIKSLKSAFYNCTNLIEVNFNNFDSSKVSIMDRTFENCESLKYLNLSSFKGDSLLSMSYTFKNCINLNNLILDSLIINENITMEGTFDNLNKNVILKFNNDTVDIIKNKYNNTCHDSDIQDIIKCIIKPIPKSSLTTITNLLSTHISISTINLIMRDYYME